MLGSSAMSQNEEPENDYETIDMEISEILEQPDENAETALPRQIHCIVQSLALIVQKDNNIALVNQLYKKTSRRFFSLAQKL